MPVWLGLEMVVAAGVADVAGRAEDSGEWPLLPIMPLLALVPLSPWSLLFRCSCPCRPRLRPRLQLWLRGLS